MDGSRVEVAVLRDVCNRILDFISKDLNISHVELDRNLYWSLPQDVRHDMQHTPTAEHVGSLADDYDFVLAAARDPDQAVPLLLEHVAPLLAELATKVPNFR